MHTDDECFFVGLGHRGETAQSARKSNFLGSDEYRPFQCCPTKLERATKVPKMTAQRLAHKNDHDKGKSGYFTFTNDPKHRVSEPEKLKKTSKPTVVVVPTAATGKKGPVEMVNDKKDIKTESKKALAKGKNKEKQGQKGLLGIGKVVNWL